MTNQIKPTIVGSDLTLTTQSQNFNTYRFGGFDKFINALRLVSELGGVIPTPQVHGFPRRHGCHWWDEEEVLQTLLQTQQRRKERPDYVQLDRAVLL